MFDRVEWNRWTDDREMNEDEGKAAGIAAGPGPCRPRTPHRQPAPSLRPLRRFQNSLNVKKTEENHRTKYVMRVTLA